MRGKPVWRPWESYHNKYRLRNDNTGEDKGGIHVNNLEQWKINNTSIKYAVNEYTQSCFSLFHLYGRNFKNVMHSFLCHVTSTRKLIHLFIHVRKRVWNERKLRLCESEKYECSSVYFFFFCLFSLLICGKFIARLKSCSCKPEYGPPAWPTTTPSMSE